MLHKTQLLKSQPSRCSGIDTPSTRSTPLGHPPPPWGVPIMRANDAPRTVSWYLAPFRCSLSWRRYVTNGHPAPALSSRSTRVSTSLPHSFVTINTGSAPSCSYPHSSRSTRGHVGVSLRKKWSSCPCPHSSRSTQGHVGTTLRTSGCK